MAIAFDCPKCDGSVRAKEELAGRRIKCPKCGAVIGVPAMDGAIAEGPPAKGAPADDEDRPRKKKKKKKKSRMPLIIGLSAGAVLLAVGAVIIIIVLNQGDGDAGKQAKAAPLEPVPPPADGFRPAPAPPAPPATGIRRAPQRTEISNALKQLYLAYLNYCDTVRRAPQKWEDLEPYYEKNRAITDLLKTKYLIFLCGTMPTQMSQGSSNTVLAYESQLDQQGIRLALMGDGSVTFLTAAEFEAAPKAGQR